MLAFVYSKCQNEISRLLVNLRNFNSKFVCYVPFVYGKERRSEQEEEIQNT